MTIIMDCCSTSKNPQNASVQFLFFRKQDLQIFDRLNFSRLIFYFDHKRRQVAVVHDLQAQR